MEHCTEDDCTRPVFTRKSGLCQRHYDRARTARVAAERPALVLVRDTPCTECQRTGYKRWPEGSTQALCKTHWDMLRRRGTVKPAEKVTGPAVQCLVDGCITEVHSKGLCQTHYRKMLRNGSPTAVVPVGRPRQDGSTDHRKMSDEERERRRQQRIETRTHCAREHELVGENRALDRNGNFICRTCRNQYQAEHRERHRGEPTPERLVCSRGLHDISDPATYTLTAANYKRCKLCTRASNIRHLYGLTLEQWQQMWDEQTGDCAICLDPLVEGKDVHVDHDHECCPGSQSCGKCVRGLLCRGCNIMLGQAKDDVEVLLAAVSYIRKHRVD